MSSKYLRRAALAGSWYPASKDALISTLDKCFLSSFGPGSLPKRINKSNGNDKVVGIIAPHAGYTYSGGVASNGYKEIAEDGIPDTIILIGSHGGFSGIYLQTEGAWESPLGITDIDSELAVDVADNVKEIEEENSYMLRITDNTFELQLPFIQYLSKDIKLVPIAVGSRDFKKIKRAASQLSSVLAPYFDPKNEHQEKKVTIVSSTDLTHYGKFSFGFAPADGQSPEKQNEWIKQNDLNVINKILNLPEEDVGEILNFAIDHRNLCCPGAISLGIETIKQLSSKCNFNKLGISLLKQATSFDVEPSRSIGGFSAVGYASILFSRE
ncbi:MAG: AmmeMemoRadiSam system protein B [Promethearchaeota archaeon]